MFIYLTVLILGFVYYFVDRRSSIIGLFLFFFFLSFFIGVGDMIGGYDRYIYGEIFDRISDTTMKKGNLKDFLVYINGSEYGYFFWEVLCSYVTQNRYVFILLGTLLMYVLYFRAFVMYMSNYPVATIVFLGFVYYFTMTYMRETMAIGIAWQGIKYIWERKPLQYFLIVILAASFHNSAVVMIPLYFIPIKKISPQRIILILFLCLIVGISPLPEWIIARFGESTGMEARTAKYVEDEMSGFRLDYIIESIILIGFLLKNYKLIKSKPMEITFSNIYVVFCGVLLMFLRFGQGGRFGWYYMIGIIYIFSRLSTLRKSTKWNKVFVFVLSTLLFVRITSLWAFNLTPYKTFFSNGYPSGETYIYWNWEYDYNYTKDKLYRDPWILW